MNIKKNLKTLIPAILIPLAAGGASALLAGGFDSYEKAPRPPLSPPAILFPIVWTILYILMGISAWLVERDTTEKKPLVIYYIQLAVNALWSIIFFRFEMYLASAVWLGLLIVWIIFMITEFAAVNRKAALLQLPYLVWCLFALYLNIGVYLLSR